MVKLIGVSVCVCVISLMCMCADDLCFSLMRTEPYTENSDLEKNFRSSSSFVYLFLYCVDDFIHQMKMVAQFPLNSTANSV